VTLANRGRAGVKQWLGRFLRWRVGWRWYVGVIGGVPLVLTVAGLFMASGEHEGEPMTMTVVLSYLPLLALQMLTTGLAEEPGWRDFALPRLQPRFGPLGANMILGPLWGCWHLPLFLTSWAGWPDVQISDVVEFIATAIALCIVMTWVSNKTRQSLPLQMLLHSSINNTVSVIWGSLFPTMGHDELTRGVLIVAATIAVVLLVGTRGQLGWTGTEGD
jgi:membrane protease YdiL (CAAX protease family)